MSVVSQAHLLSSSGNAFSNPEPPGGPIPYGEQVYTSAGTYYWTVPEEAAWTNVSVVIVSAGELTNGVGGGRAGGSLSYGNNIAVQYGRIYTIVVGDGTSPYQPSSPTNKNSSFSSPFYKLLETRPGPTGSVSTPERDGGGGGGLGGPFSNGWFTDGGGGAGGYTGNGGRGGGGTANPGYPIGTGTPGSGGGGGGGGGAPGFSPTSFGGDGGGVGLHGEGGYGNGRSGANNAGGNGSPGPTGVFGGGAGSYSPGTPIPSALGAGMPGGVRILWGGPPGPSGGTNRLFPGTNVS